MYKLGQITKEIMKNEMATISSDCLQRKLVLTVNYILSKFLPTKTIYIV